MVKVKDIVDIMEGLAPSSNAYSWDNVGLQIGDYDQNVKKILTTLDITDDIIDEAISVNADMIVAHHPTIFKPIKNITNNNSLGKKIRKLIQNNISIYIAHTNLDVAKGGTNDVLMELLELKNVEVLDNSEFDNGVGVGRIGELINSLTFEEFLLFVKKKLDLDCCVYSGDLSSKVSKVGVCTGSGFKYIYNAIEKGCNVFITGDVTYHQCQEAEELGICLIDGTHFATEVIIKEKLAKYINEKLNNEEIAVATRKSSNFMKYYN